MKGKVAVTGWKDWMNVKVLQKAVLVDKIGNILILRRMTSGFGSRKGKWDLPGGSMDAEDLVESPENPHEFSIKREVKEETKLEATNFIPIYVGSGGKTDTEARKILILAICYQAKVKGMSPKVTLSQEHIEYRWLSKSEALVLDFGEDGGFHRVSIQSLFLTPRWNG